MQTRMAHTTPAPETHCKKQPAAAVRRPLTQPGALEDAAAPPKAQMTNAKAGDASAWRWHYSIFGIFLLPNHADGG